MASGPEAGRATLSDDSMTDEDWRSLNAVRAEFPRSYYGEPQCFALSGRCWFQIEDEAGGMNAIEVSAEFFRAWVREFGRD